MYTGGTNKYKLKFMKNLSLKVRYFSKCIYIEFLVPVRFDYLLLNR